MTPDPRVLLEPLVPLEAVITTEQLSHRGSRQSDLAAESLALVQLAESMTHRPDQVLQRLADIALSLCKAGSAGISLIENEEGRAIFRWRALAGALSAHLLGTTPREFSPCGTVVDRNAMMLMTRLDRHYRYFADVQPPILEALLVPFRVADRAIGTVWVVTHAETARFDGEDARLISDLATFAAAAVRLWESHSSVPPRDGFEQGALDLSATYAAMRLVAQQLQQQLSEQRRHAVGSFGVQQVRADLARLIFLIDGLLHRQRTMKASPRPEHSQSQPME